MLTAPSFMPDWCKEAMGTSTGRRAEEEQHVVATAAVQSSKLPQPGCRPRCTASTGRTGTSLSAALVQASDGNFYGTTQQPGTVFKITPAGVLTSLYTFDGSDGLYPDAALVQAGDGNFYGTTYLGGASDNGTVFKITPSGTLTTLHSFDYTNGGDPVGPLYWAGTRASTGKPQWAGCTSRVRSTA